MTPQQVKRFALESVLISCKICCNNLVSNKAFFVKCFLTMKQKKYVLAKPGDALETPPPFINKLTEGLILFLPQL